MIYLLHNFDDSEYELVFKPDAEDTLYDIFVNHQYYFEFPPKLPTNFEYDNCGCDTIETYLKVDEEVTLIASFPDVDTYNTYLDNHPELLL